MPNKNEKAGGNIIPYLKLNYRSSGYPCKNIQEDKLTMCTNGITVIEQPTILCLDLMPLLQEGLQVRYCKFSKNAQL